MENLAKVKSAEDPKGGDKKLEHLLSCLVYEKHTEEAANVRNALRHLVLCHSVIVEPRVADEPTKFSASSPDEEALVLGVDSLGFKFINRDNSNNITIQCEGNAEETFLLLNELEFNSDRKRMSVIIKDSN
jgi:magnesium-transporting ATPase (P-type)